jgi:hypothetical protein
MIRAGRLLARLLAMVSVTLLLWLGAAGNSAHAAEGTPAGWDKARATEGATIGKMHLRWEPGLSDEAETLVKLAPGWWSEIEQSLAGDVDDTVEIVFVTHAGRVAEASGMPRWVAGVAHPPSGEILIAQHGPDGAPTNLEDLLKHEMAHVILHRAVGGRPLPRWFHEGVAESYTGGISLSRAQTLASAVFGPGVPDLERLEANFHGQDGPAASVAYAAARDLVSFLRSYDGKGLALRQVLTEMDNGHKLEVAFIRAYDRGLEELVAQWRSELPGRFVWYPLLASGGLPLTLVAPFILIAWIRRRRYYHRGLERLAAQEAAAMQATQQFRRAQPALGGAV